MTDAEFKQFRNDVDALKAPEDRDKLVEFLDNASKTYANDAFALSELAENYYSCEVQEFDKAFKCALRSYKLSPDDPFICYRYGCSLYYKDNYSKAIDIFQIILNSAVEDITSESCSEGKNYALSLLNDTRFMLGVVYLDMGAPTMAEQWLKEHLRNRKRGIFSDFSRKQVLQILEEISERQ